MTVYPSNLDKGILYYNKQIRNFEEIKKIRAVTLEDYERAARCSQTAEWLEELSELRKQKRKTGKWIDDPYIYQCSKCGSYVEIKSGDAAMNYCPNCGSFNGGDEE